MDIMKRAGVDSGHGTSSPVHPGMKVPLLAGIMVGSVVLALGLSVASVRCYRRRRQREEDEAAPWFQPGLWHEAEKVVKSSSQNTFSSSTSQPLSSHGSQTRLAMAPGLSRSCSGGAAGNPPLVLPDKESGGSDGDKSPYLGYLYFTTEHDAGRGTLLVTVLRVADLPATATGSADPYVKLQLLPEKKHRVKTRVLRKTTHPVYDETFTFYGIDAQQLAGITLHFVVLSFDRFSRDEILGEVVYPLEKVDLSKEVSVCSEISSRQLKLQQQGRGEILLSLCYQPAANRLTCVVLKAKNLPKLDFTGLSDPFVKVYLLHEGQRVAKKKTHVKRRTLTPVFNESFVFEIPGESIGAFGIEVQVMDWDRMTKNEVMGTIEISSRSSSRAVHHWTEVVNSPRKMIAEWHKLE